MAIRIPRGFERNRPYYQEISKGERFAATAVPMTAYTGLSPVRIDEHNHDPIVLDPGTIVGLATGSPAAGTLMPAHWQTGNNNVANYYEQGHSDGATWGLATTSGSVSVGHVKPIGVVYQPIYSFQLQAQFTNYKRNENVGVLTDYIIQVPCLTAKEHLIDNGDSVRVVRGDVYNGIQNIGMSANSTIAGRYERVEYASWESGSAQETSEIPARDMIVGRCIKKTAFGTSSSAVIGTALVDALSTFTISTAGAAEFKALAKVTTVPGLNLAGDITKGVPGWLLGARQNSAGTYSMLTILIRL